MSLTAKITNAIKVRCVLLTLLVCLFTSISAQTDSTAVNTQPTTSFQQNEAPVEFRVPGKEKIKEFKNDRRFNYNEPERGTSLWDRVKFWILEAISDIIGAVSNSGVPGIAVILVLVLVICLILLKILGVDYRKILGKKEIDTPEIDIYTENVHKMDFDTLISNALKNKDYRLVIRFLYLKNLKLLADKEIINWNANKTNYSYQHEISDSSLRSKFLEATLIFDYIWYGEFPLDENRYIEIHTRMDDFNKMIANER